MMVIPIDRGKAKTFKPQIILMKEAPVTHRCGGKTFWIGLNWESIPSFFLGCSRCTSLFIATSYYLAKLFDIPPNKGIEAFIKYQEAGTFHSPAYPSPAKVE